MLTCPSCARAFEAKQYHAGFSELGFLYCTTDSTVLTFSVYDKTYTDLVGEKQPWHGYLTAAERQAVENALVSCPCGGRFVFGSPLRCPNCGARLADSSQKTIYFYVTGLWMDGEKTNVWKRPNHNSVEAQS